MSFGRCGGRIVPTNDFGDRNGGFGRSDARNEISGGGSFPPQRTGGFAPRADDGPKTSSGGGFEWPKNDGGFGRSRVTGADGLKTGSFGGRPTGGGFDQPKTSNGGGFEWPKNEGGFGRSNASTDGKVGDFGRFNDNDISAGGGGFGQSNNNVSGFGGPRTGGSFGRLNNDNGFGGQCDTGGGFGRPNNNAGGFGRSNNDAGGFGGPKNDNGFGRPAGGNGFDRQPVGFAPRPDELFGGSKTGGDDNHVSEFSDRPSSGYDGGVGPSHVPKQRTVDDIFQEDANASENYSQIRAEDDNVVITGLVSTETIVVAETWAEANLEPSLMANIERAKYMAPRKIQSYAIPIIMEGFDVKGHAETGSGKTAAFLIPIINMIICKKASGEFKSRRSHPYALIIEPTRELATQLYEQARKLAYKTGVSVAVTYGKYRIQDNLREISNGCDILVGTPGRLRDFFQREYVLAEDLKVLVLDETDYLLEADFMVEIRKICSVPKFPSKENCQTLLFSATFSPNVQQWADEILRQQNVMISNQKFTSANNRVVQNFMLVFEADKKEQLIKLLKDELEEKRAGLAAGEQPRLRRTLVFVQRKRDADVLSTYLCQEGIRSTTINGDRTQELREQSLKQFRTYQVDVVVSTDVCARGIDIKDLDHVINFDLPSMSQSHEDYVTYVHRIGRTGRIKEGVATSFFDPAINADLAVDLVTGVREAGQVPPDFLIEAFENQLVMPASKEEDDAWGVNTKKMASLSTGDEGGAKLKTTNGRW